MTHSPGPMPDAQTQALPPQPGNGLRPTGTFSLITPIVAVVAVIVAFAGLVIAAVAVGRSNQAMELARSTTNHPAPAMTTPEAPPTTTPTDPQPGTIDPSAQLSTGYDEQRLRIPSGGCDEDVATQVDLDEPRVLGATADAADFGYSGCSPGKIETELSFAQLAGPDATPADCLDAIRTNPAQSPLTPAEGQTLCVVTGPKLVFVTIDGDDDDALSVTVKAWKVTS